LLKQTVDELKTLCAEYVEDLRKQREALGTYHPVPALEAGSVEAHRAIAAHEHRGRVAPELTRLTHRIRLLKSLPAVVYGVLTIALLVWISILEARGQ